MLGLVTTHPLLASHDKATAAEGDDDARPRRSWREWMADTDGEVPGTFSLLARTGTPLTLTVTCELETLLGLADRPGHVLTRLTGGRLRVSAHTARRLADLGASIRLLVVDGDGDVIGIGRRSRVAPGWLRDAVTTMFPTSIGPGSKTSSAHCDLDHHHEWHADDGPTDLSNLAPVDRQFHTAKTNGAWTIRSGPDGTRIVEHAPSGWSQTIIPATRRIELTPAGGSDPPR